MERHDEEKKKVVLTPEDVKNVEDFLSHFKIPCPEKLGQCIAKFKADPKGFTFDDQRLMRAYLAHFVDTADHPLVKDDVFKNIRAKCNKAWYDSQFEMDLEEILVDPVVAEATSK